MPSFLTKSASSTPATWLLVPELVVARSPPLPVVGVCCVLPAGAGLAEVEVHPAALTPMAAMAEAFSALPSTLSVPRPEEAQPP